MFNLFFNPLKETELTSLSLCLLPVAYCRHGSRLEESGEQVTRALVQQLVSRVVEEDQREEVAGQLFMELVTKRNFPEFITTYLSECHTFQARHK